MINNDNNLNFKELYLKLYNENFKELEKLRMKLISKLLIAILLVIVSFYINFTLGLIMIILEFFFGVFFITAIIAYMKSFRNRELPQEKSIITKFFVKTIKEMRVYKSSFEEKIILPIVQAVFPNAKYFPDLGISEEEYRNADWEVDSFNQYYSENKIISDIETNEEQGIKSKITLSEVQVNEVNKGDTTDWLLFQGVVAYVDLPIDIGCYIKIINNRKNIFSKKEDKIEMDALSFERLFDVETDNKLKSMQLLTSDVMLQLKDLLCNNKIKFEINIRNNIMYIRFHIGEMFEPTFIRRTMNFTKLKRDFSVLNSIKNITQCVCKVIINTEL